VTKTGTPTPTPDPSPTFRPWFFDTRGWVFSSPAVADGVVYVGSGSHNVYALDAVTGARRWTYDAGDTLGSSPVVSGGVVYIGSPDRRVHAIDAATGDRRWTFTSGVRTGSRAVSRCREAASRQVDPRSLAVTRWCGISAATRKIRESGA
jgi:glucose dehydrogenase